MQERELGVGEGIGQWIEDVSNRKVDEEDFREIVRTLQNELPECRSD